MLSSDTSSLINTNTVVCSGLAQQLQLMFALSFGCSRSACYQRDRQRLYCKAIALPHVLPQTHDALPSRPVLSQPSTSPMQSQQTHTSSHFIKLALLHAVSKGSSKTHCLLPTRLGVTTENKPAPYESCPSAGSYLCC